MNDSPISPGSAKFPTFARFLRWFFTWRTLGRLLAGLGILATLIALACAEENWRGKRAWHNYKRELAAKGEKLDWKDFVPSPVPDDQNFTMTPFLAPLFDFNPSPRPQGQSIWRDTNGYGRITAFQNEVGTLQQAISDRDDPYRTSLQMTDLQAWALALTGKTNAPPDTAPAGMTRPEAAAEVLRALEKYTPVLDELRRASQRPHARFNVRYDDPSVMATLLPHLATLKSLTLVFRLRACAELALDQADQAWSDTQMALYLAETLNDEPFMISRLVQVSLVQLALQPVWEGLAEHKWSDAQLAAIEQRLGKLNLLADAALRGERASDIRAIEQTRREGSFDLGNSDSGTGLFAFLLGGFFYQNQLFIARMYEQCFVPAVDAVDQRLYPSRAIANEKILNQELESGFKPYRMYARILLPSLVGGQSRFGFGQTRVNEAIVACGLERYRLAHGQFPESLDTLSPAFVQRLPHDLITGAPLKYRRTADGQYVLYSVGWNEKDDAGTVALKKGSKPTADLTQGDWVWPYPAPVEPQIKPTASVPASRSP